MTSIAVIQSTRPPFLVLTPICVFLGASTVLANQSSIDIFLAGLVLFSALLAHAGVNLLNEYLDFKSGLDLTTARTPFSGGSGALPRHPELAGAVLNFGLLCLIALAITGCYLMWRVGSGILPLGIAGLLLITTYTHWLNRHPLLCLVAPGCGFGLLMVPGTQFVLTGEYAVQSGLVALVPFFLTNNLLLLNQYPDIQADIKVGRKHFPIAYGVAASNRVYAVFALAAAAVVVARVVAGYLPALSLIALLTMPLAGYAWYGAVKYGESIGRYPHFMGANVAVALLTPLLLAISITIG